MTLGLLAAVPVQPSRDSARSLVRRELSKPEYSADNPGLAQRALTWLWNELRDLLERAAGATPGGATGLAVVVLVLVLAVIAIRVTVGPVTRSRVAEPALFTGRARTSAEHRAAADEHAIAGRWAESVRERLRAIVRGLEERGLIDERPGRTADEAATQAGLVLPSCRDGLLTAAAVFDVIWYGGRPATSDHDRLLRSVDDDVRAARPGEPAARPGEQRDDARHAGRPSPGFGPPR